MNELVAALQDNGINLRDLGAGNHHSTCPQCSASRKKKTDKCLNVTIGADGGAVWYCHHCQWAGNYSGRTNGLPFPQSRPERTRAAPVRPAPVENPEKPESMYGWFEGRAISRETVDQFGCFITTQYFSQTKKTSGASHSHICTAARCLITNTGP